MLVAASPMLSGADAVPSHTSSTPTGVKVCTDEATFAGNGTSDHVPF